MGFQNNCSLAIFIPQTNPLLIHMMKTRIVGNVIRRPLARSGFCLFYFSEPFKAWKAAYTASWEGCKLQASEFSSGATRVNGLWKKYRMTWLFAETIFNVKIAEAMLWVPIFAIEKTSMVESISVCMLTNWRYSCPTAIYGQSCYHPEETSALTEGHRFRELWVTKKYAVALYRKPKSKKGKKKIPRYTCAEKGWTWPLCTYKPILLHWQHRPIKATQIYGSSRLGGFVQGKWQLLVEI